MSEYLEWNRFHFLFQRNIIRRVSTRCSEKGYCRGNAGIKSKEICR